MLALNEDSIVGRVVGPYRVVGRLGSHGDFPLYEADHLLLDRKVALRLIVPDDAVSGVVDGFLARARKVSRIKHDNVIGLLDLGESADGFVYLAMELPEGPSLAQVISERGPVPSARAKFIARQIGAAFIAAERQSLGCEEIATEQIFLCKDHGGAEIVRVDFAVGDILGGGAPTTPDTFASQGSVYALGRLLYHMVVGHPPPPVERDEPPPDPTLSRPDLDIPVALDALIVRALDPNPAKRWPDIASLMHVIGDSDRRPSARGMGYIGADVYGSAEHRAFGRTMFRRPSGRAVIAGGVATSVAFALIAVLVAARRGQPSREQVPREQMGNPVVIQLPAVPPAMKVPTHEPSKGSAGAVSASSRAGQATASSWAAGRGVDVPPRSNPTSAGPLEDEASGAGGATNGGKRLAAIAPPPNRDENTATTAAGRAGTGDDACAVTLGSRPWSEVWIDGRQVGFTPLVDYPIDCGTHDVLFKNSDSHTEKRVSIVVASGQPFKRTVDFSPQAACVVTLGSRPWSEVWIDGRRVGVTPLVEYPVACGKHEVLFRNNDSKIERREAIVVQNGQLLKKVVALVED